MKKDIEIPVDDNVFVAIIREWNEEFQMNDWTAYVINNRKDPIEMVIAVAKGFDGDKKTATMRHGLGTIGARHFTKIEVLQDDILGLNNEFFVTFFAENKMYEKRFTFLKNTVTEQNLIPIPVINKNGILV